MSDYLLLDRGKAHPNSFRSLIERPKTFYQQTEVSPFGSDVQIDGQTIIKQVEMKIEEFR